MFGTTLGRFITPTATDLPADFITPEFFSNPDCDPSGNRLEALGGYRAGQHSIRINDQYRICFEWSETGPRRVEIVDYHK